MTLYYIVLKVKGKLRSHVRLLATPWTAAHQTPPSMGFARQEYWSGVPFPSPQGLRNQELKLEWFCSGERGRDVAARIKEHQPLH